MFLIIFPEIGAVTRSLSFFLLFFLIFLTFGVFPFFRFQYNPKKANTNIDFYSMHTTMRNKTIVLLG